MRLVYLLVALDNFGSQAKQKPEKIHIAFATFVGLFTVLPKTILP